MSNRNGVSDETSADKESSVHDILSELLLVTPLSRSLISTK